MKGILLFVLVLIGPPAAILPVIGEATSSSSTTCALPLPDFSMQIVPSPSSVGTGPSSQILPLGTFSSFMVTFRSLNFFFGTVNLSLGLSPVTASLPSASLEATSLFLGAGGIDTIALDVAAPSATTLGNYTVTVTAISAAVSHSATGVIVVVMSLPFFIMEIAPLGLNITGAGSAAATITVKSYNNFSGSVFLTDFFFLPVPNGLTASLSDPVLSLPANGTATSSLTVSSTSSTTGGDFTLDIIATGAAWERAMPVRITVIAPLTPDFVVSLEHDYLTLFRQGSNFTHVDVTMLNGYSQSLAVSFTVSPALENGPSISTLFLNSVKPPGLAFTMIVSAAADTPSGIYTITITASHDSLSHSTTLALNVLPISMPIYSGTGLVWTHNISLSDSNCEVWTATITNPNSDTGLWVKLHVQGLLTADSSPVFLEAGRTKSEITATLIVTNMVQPGFKFSFTASIEAGLTQDRLTQPLGLVTPSPTVISGFFKVST